MRSAKRAYIVLGPIAVQCDFTGYDLRLEVISATKIIFALKSRELQASSSCRGLII